MRGSQARSSQCARVGRMDVDSWGSPVGGGAVEASFSDQLPAGALVPQPNGAEHARPSRPAIIAIAPLS